MIFSTFKISLQEQLTFILNPSYFTKYKSFSHHKERNTQPLISWLASKAGFSYCENIIDNHIQQDYICIFYILLVFIKHIKHAGLDHVFG